MFVTTAKKKIFGSGQIQVIKHGLLQFTFFEYMPKDSFLTHMWFIIYTPAGRPL